MFHDNYIIENDIFSFHIQLRELWNVRQNFVEIHDLHKYIGGSNSDYNKGYY